MATRAGWQKRQTPKPNQKKVQGRGLSVHPKQVIAPYHMNSNHFAWPSEVWLGNQKCLRQNLTLQNNKIPRPFGSGAFIWLGDILYIYIFIYIYMYIPTCPHAGDLMEQTLEIDMPQSLEEIPSRFVSCHFSDGWMCGSRKCNYTQQRAGWRLFGCRSLAMWIWSGHRWYSWCRCSRLLWSGYPM